MWFWVLFWSFQGYRWSRVGTVDVGNSSSPPCSILRRLLTGERRLKSIIKVSRLIYTFNAYCKFLEYYSFISIRSMTVHFKIRIGERGELLWRSSLFMFWVAEVKITPRWIPGKVDQDFRANDDSWEEPPVYVGHSNAWILATFLYTPLLLNISKIHHSTPMLDPCMHSRFFLLLCEHILSTFFDNFTGHQSFNNC